MINPYLVVTGQKIEQKIAWDTYSFFVGHWVALSITVSIVDRTWTMLLLVLERSHVGQEVFISNAGSMARNCMEQQIKSVTAFKSASWLQEEIRILSAVNAIFASLDEASLGC